MRIFTFLFLLFPIAAFAQGIQFEEGNWKSVLAKAKQQNRLVYVDVYTTWCGPCKVLQKTIFPQKEAGDKYNPLFVNYSLDAEKGEGVAFAKKYSVTGFPTHLFIDPKTEKVVYRTMGAAGGVARFNEHADVALIEKADPMTWELFSKSFASGKRSPDFLKAYLRKAERLDKPNDAILDAYVATLDKSNLPDSTLYFLAARTHTLWNKAIPILEANKGRLDKEVPGDGYYGYEHQMESWLYPSYEVAIAEKSEKKLEQLVQFIRANITEDPEDQIFGYRKGYYEGTNNPVKRKQIETTEANRLTAQTLADYTAADAKTRKNQEESIRYQLSAMTLPEGSNIDTIVAKNLANQVESLPSMRAASTLNSLAWKTFEDKKATAADLQQAMKWSAKAMEFLPPHHGNWPGYADTHASLLYRTGEKQEAIALEEKALKTIREAQSEKAGLYEKTLEQMKAGTY